MTDLKFQPRQSVAQVEEGTDLAPKFGEDGLLPCITTDAATGDVLMLGWMNAEAFRLTIQTGEAHYFSRARQVLWHKGAHSGLVQELVEARIDDDQDALWLRVDVTGSGASCHVGYRSCFTVRCPMGNRPEGRFAFLKHKRHSIRWQCMAMSRTRPNSDLDWMQAAKSLWHIQRVKRLIREHIGGGAACLVSVRETVCSDPGCPDKATEVRITSLSFKETRFIIHKPVSAVRHSDISAMI